MKIHLPSKRWVYAQSRGICVWQGSAVRSSCSASVRLIVAPKSQYVLQSHLSSIISPIISFKLPLGTNVKNILCSVVQYSTNSKTNFVALHVTATWHLLTLCQLVFRNPMFKVFCAILAFPVHCVFRPVSSSITRRLAY